MEKKLPFTGILSNKAEENPGICVLALRTICISKRDFLLLLFHLTCVTAQVLIWFGCPCLQISSTGTGSSYDTVMGHLLVETVRTRLVSDHLWFRVIVSLKLFHLIGIKILLCFFFGLTNIMTVLD